jgi:hypothetical protein
VSGCFLRFSFQPSGPQALRSGLKEAPVSAGRTPQRSSPTVPRSGPFRGSMPVMNRHENQSSPLRSASPCNLMASGALGGSFFGGQRQAIEGRRLGRLAIKRRWKRRPRVERKLTSPSKIKGHEIAASEDHPESLPRSETRARSPLTNLSV